jgi:hypothetical protein
MRIIENYMKILGGLNAEIMVLWHVVLCFDCYNMNIRETQEIRFFNRTKHDVEGLE